MAAFPVGTLVWGRVAGHPRWPAQVGEVGAGPKAGQSHVFFYGDASSAWLPEKELQPFAEHLSANGRAAKSAAFVRAVEDAQATGACSFPAPLLHRPSSHEEQQEHGAAAMALARAACPRLALQSLRLLATGAVADAPPAAERALLRNFAASRVRRPKRAAEASGSKKRARAEEAPTLLPFSAPLLAALRRLARAPLQPAASGLSGDEALTLLRVREAVRERRSVGRSRGHADSSVPDAANLAAPPLDRAARQERDTVARLGCEAALLRALRLAAAAPAAAPVGKPQRRPKAPAAAEGRRVPEKQAEQPRRGGVKGAPVAPPVAALVAAPVAAPQQEAPKRRTGLLIPKKSAALPSVAAVAGLGDAAQPQPPAEWYDAPLPPPPPPPPLPPPAAPAAPPMAPRVDPRRVRALARLHPRSALTTAHKQTAADPRKAAALSEPPLPPMELQPVDVDVVRGLLRQMLEQQSVLGLALAPAPPAE